MIEKLARDILQLLMDAGLATVRDQEAEEMARAIIWNALTKAYRAGDNHGINNPHPGESMGR